MSVNLHAEGKTQQLCRLMRQLQDTMQRLKITCLKAGAHSLHQTNKTSRFDLLRLFGKLLKTS
jgi:hypothetical protein